MRPIFYFVSFSKNVVFQSWHFLPVLQQVWSRYFNIDITYIYSNTLISWISLKLNSYLVKHSIFLPMISRLALFIISRLCNDLHSTLKLFSLVQYHIKVVFDTFHKYDRLLLVSFYFTCKISISQTLKMTEHQSPLCL